jgi:hypothetical protein
MTLSVGELAGSCSWKRLEGELALSRGSTWLPPNCAKLLLLFTLQVNNGGSINVLLTLANLNKQTK